MLRLDITNTLCCMMAGRVRQSRGWEHEGRKYVSRNLFLFIIDGKADFRFWDRSFHLERGDVLLIP
ncbi:MAG: hypothetical protein J6B77_06195, partial [Clostridia bacterium]|nr:hypothetical protein [Clostridia bacterium]